MAAIAGPPVPAVAALGGERRQSLPTTLVEALDKIGDQIEIEILDPLLCAASVEQLAGTFERLFNTFRDYYISTVLILWGVSPGRRATVFRAHYPGFSGIGTLHPDERSALDRPGRFAQRSEWACHRDSCREGRDEAR